MNKFHKETLKCPTCQESIEAVFWDKITIEETAELQFKEDVKTGKLFKAVCPNCQMTYHLNYPVLYEDKQHHFMIYYIPNESKNVQVDFPDTNDSSYTYRIAGTYFEFIEKILIFENQLNDIVIELIKAVMLQKEKNLQKCKGVYFAALSDKKISFQILGHEHAFISYPRDAYEELAKNLKFRQIDDFQLINLKTFNNFIISSKQQ